MASSNGSDLITASVNYHGQQLRTLIEMHHVGLLPALGLSTFDFQRYQSRARELAMQPRTLRHRLLDFIARNVDELFVPVDNCESLPSPSCDKSGLNSFDLPILGDAMGVPKGEYRHQIATVLRKGDLVLTEVVGYRHNGMVSVSISAILTLNYLVLPRTCYIRANLVNTEISDKHKRVLCVHSLVLAVVISCNANSSIFLSISNKDLPPQLGGVFNLGLIKLDELHMRCRPALQTDSIPGAFECHLHESVLFKNSNIILKISKNINVPLKRMTLLSNFSSEATASSLAMQLRRVQSSRFAMRLVSKGVDYFKQGNIGEASQCLNQALNVDQKNVDALVARGALLANRGNYIKAIDDFKLALNINSSHPNAIKYMRGVLLSQVKVFEDKGHLIGVMEMLDLCRIYFMNDYPLISFLQGIVDSLSGRAYRHTSSAGIESSNLPVRSEFSTPSRSPFPPPTRSSRRTPERLSNFKCFSLSSRSQLSESSHPTLSDKSYCLYERNTATDNEYEARVDRFLESLKSPDESHRKYNTFHEAGQFSKQIARDQLKSHDSHGHIEHGLIDRFQCDKNIFMTSERSNRDRRSFDRLNSSSRQPSPTAGARSRSDYVSDISSQYISKSPSGLLQRSTLFEENNSGLSSKKFMMPSSALTGLDVQEKVVQSENLSSPSKDHGTLPSDDFLYCGSALSSLPCNDSGGSVDVSDSPNTCLKQLLELREEIKHLKEKRDKRKKRRLHRSISPPHSSDIKHKSAQDNKMLKVFEDYSTVKPDVCENVNERKIDFKINLKPSVNELITVNPSSKQSDQVQSLMNDNVNPIHQSENVSGYRSIAAHSTMEAFRQRRASHSVDGNGQTGDYHTSSSRADVFDQSERSVNFSCGSVSSRKDECESLNRYAPIPKGRSIHRHSTDVSTHKYHSKPGENRSLRIPNRSDGRINNLSTGYKRASSFSHHERYTRRWYSGERR